ncbi:class I SAM-dependent methyltransferase [Streptomyces abikoensis]|uniref:class I SAM-dependent methyltransferase n=1 Tax=Streptomyces abikoensis TaxID=97398 RepID=UPI0036D1D142
MDRSAEAARLRPAYQRELALGTERFHHPRSTECPWCGSARLRTRLRTVDLIQRKPGTFVLDQCRDCAHSFQNPRLTADGLDFYYRDFYEGFSGEALKGFADADFTRKRYRAAARSVLPFCRPKRWLDVGTSKGHFPQAAREIHPSTVFDGLDIGEGVEHAERLGRVTEGHRGRLTDLAPKLAGRYDVVSMFHCLEHTPDPRQELAAALAVLEPGGHLVIEVPDPECLTSRILGRWWMPYFQPQHLHLIPLANLRAELESLGCTVVAVDRREPHIPLDLSGAVLFAVSRYLPRDDAPWYPAPPGRLRRALRRALFWAAVPPLIAAYAVDRLTAPLVRRTRFSNAYRVVARAGGVDGG